jgi:hypothetical protein
VKESRKEKSKLIKLINLVIVELNYC